VSGQLVVTGSPVVGETLTMEAPAGAHVAWCRDGSFGSGWAQMIDGSNGQRAYVVQAADVGMELRAIAIWSSGGLGISEPYLVKATASPTPVPVPTPAPTPAPPPAAATGGRLLRGALLIGSAASASMLTADIGVLIIQLWRSDLLTAMRRLNPACICLAYREFGAVSVIEDGQCDSAVTYVTAVANGWVLGPGAGLLLNSFSGQYAADVGAAGYRQAVAAAVVSQCHAAGFDGAMLDDVNPSINGIESTKYTAAEYADETTGAIGVIGPAVQAAGLKVIGNIGSWGDNPAWGDGLVDDLSGGLMEMDLGWGSTSGMGRQGVSIAEAQVTSAQKCALAGKMFVAVCQALDSDAPDVSYVTAANAVVVGPAPAVTAICYANDDDYSQAVDVPEFATVVALGQATGSVPSVVGAGAIVREYERGTVTFDAGEQSGSLALASV
jgi:hypothetical protein